MARLALCLCVALALAATASAGPHDPKLRFTRAGQALARRAVVHLSDLRGWRPISRRPARARCRGSYDPDFSRLTVTGQARSAFALSNRALLSSKVAVYVEERQAAAAFRIAVTRGFLACAGTKLLEGFARANIGARIVSKTMTRGPSLGTRNTTFRIVFSVSVRSRTTPYFAEVIAFQIHKAIAELAFQGYGRRIRGDLAVARKVANRLGGRRRT
jgi:hypothetical protein